jgi:hypothetical protein
MKNERCSSDCRLAPRGTLVKKVKRSFPVVVVPIPHLTTTVLLPPPRSCQRTTATTTVVAKVAASSTSQIQRLDRTTPPRHPPSSLGSTHTWSSVVAVWPDHHIIISTASWDHLLGSSPGAPTGSHCNTPGRST